MKKKIKGRVLKENVEGLADGPFHPTKGIAFIKVYNMEPKVFLHFSNLLDQSEMDRLKKGTVVLFDMMEGEKGPVAVRARIESDPVLEEPVIAKSRRGVVRTWPWNYGYIQIDELWAAQFCHASALERTSYLRPGDVVDVQEDNAGKVTRVVSRDQWDGSNLSPYEKDLDMGNPTHWIRTLAEMSPERWDVKGKQECGILRQYFKFTYLRQKELPDHLVLNDDVMCWNTGLMDESGDDILVLFKEKPEDKVGPKWKFDRFLTVADKTATHLRDAPRARYWDDPADLIYDTDKGEPTVQSEHIGEKVDERFPEHMANYTQQDLIRAVQEAARDAVKRVVQNYKTAIPQFYRPSGGRGEGSIQLLLPLRFPGDQRPSLALAVRRDGDAYYASTVLKIEWAYTYARLLSKPDTEWLNPFED